MNAGDRAPVIVQTPSDTHAFVESSFFLTCEANALLIDTYQWMKDGVALSSSTDLTILPGEGMEVRSAKKSHSGKYYCVVTNGAGAVNASATVEVTSTVITCDGKYAGRAFK